jgi:ribosomal protein S18 acetylase RimI-like enzyme
LELEGINAEVFSQAHYNEYLSWFDNPFIKKALGSIDEEWLNYILKDQSGKEYAFILNEKLVAVAGITYPNLTHPFYVLNNLAVNPGYQRKGIGQSVLQLLFQLHQLEATEYWAAYVHEGNGPAQDFFQSNGWKKAQHIMTKDKMIQYEINL